jgi:hypothetical protein
MPISFLYLPDLEGLRVAVGLTSCAASVPPHRRSPRLSSTAATRSPSKPISLTSRSACAPDGTDQVGRRSASLAEMSVIGAPRARRPSLIAPIVYLISRRTRSIAGAWEVSMSCDGTASAGPFVQHSDVR